MKNSVSNSQISENMSKSEMSKLFLDISKRDLKSSKLLYSNNCYPQAVFYFQQSVEKAIKSLAIIMEGIKKDPKELGHTGMKFYKTINDNFKEKVIEFKNNSETTETISQIMGFDSENLQQDIEDIENNLSKQNELCISYITNKENYTKLNHEELIEILQILNQMEKDYKEEMLKKSELFLTEEDFTSFKKETSDMVRKIYEYYSLNSDEFNIHIPINVDKIVEAKLEELFDVTDKETWNQFTITLRKTNYVFNSLHYLSLITDPHAIKARYPDKNFNPLDFYTTELPLIKEYQSFIEITEKLLYEVDDISTNTKIFQR